MEIRLCDVLVTTVTYPITGTTWLNYENVLTNVTSGGTGTCNLEFKSIAPGAGGVTPTNVQLVPLGSETVNDYPMIPIDGEPGCPLTIADYKLEGSGKRCQEAGILVPNSVWNTYPPVAEGGPANTGVGLPGVSDCWYYCR